jgi:bifunctional DNase/RNase
MNSFLRSFSAIVCAACIEVAVAGVSMAADKNPDEAPNQMLRVQNVEVISSPVGPVVVLKLRNKSVPVFVDPVVALSIRSALAGDPPARPLSHDLMRTILDSLDAKVTQAVITLKDGTYYGALTIDVRGKPQVFDSRSSDAIALAVRFKAPILIDPSLLEAAGVEQTEERSKPI